MSRLCQIQRDCDERYAFGSLEDQLEILRGSLEEALAWVEHWDQEPSSTSKAQCASGWSVLEN